MSSILYHKIVMTLWHKITGQRKIMKIENALDNPRPLRSPRKVDYGSALAQKIPEIL